MRRIPTKPADAAIHGWLVIDKPAGITSSRVVGQLRRSTGAKTGHAGTLDPLATGVLPVALGEATKTAQFVSEVVIRELHGQGANVVATGPGKVVAYAGNPLTLAALKKAGVEVTTFRGEGPYLDGRRPSSVVFLGDIEGDLARRDFTVNAMAWDPLAGELRDPFGGAQDLRQGLLRAVGDTWLPSGRR